jgi:hypothetical protein
MLQVPSFSFVQFSGAREVLPFRSAGDLSFQVVSDDSNEQDVPKPPGYLDAQIKAIALTDLDGNVLSTSTFGIHQTGNVYNITPSFDSYPDCFRIALCIEIMRPPMPPRPPELILYPFAISSTVFAVTSSKYISNINYLCDDDSFDFAYCETKFVNRVCLPVYLKEAQFPQKQTVYDRRDGRRKLLSASISKEWEMETDYLSEAIHEKLIIALSHDEVYINGKLVTKTGDYSIDYSGILKRGGVEYMKGSCKVSANVTHRNSNCGNTCEAEGFDFDVQPRGVIFSYINT